MPLGVTGWQNVNIVAQQLKCEILLINFINLIIIYAINQCRFGI